MRWIGAPVRGQAPPPLSLSPSLSLSLSLSLSHSMRCLSVVPFGTAERERESGQRGSSNITNPQLHRDSAHSRGSLPRPSPAPRAMQISPSTQPRYTFLLDTARSLLFWLFFGSCTLDVFLAASFSLLLLLLLVIFSCRRESGDDIGMASKTRSSSLPIVLRYQFFSFARFVLAHSSGKSSSFLALAL